MARSSRGEDARFSFWKQGFDSPTGYEKPLLSEAAFFMLSILVNPHFPSPNYYFRQSAKTTDCNKLQRVKTADKRRLIFIPDHSRTTIPLLFIIYLQNLHFYLQSKPLDRKNINVDSLNQFERI